MSLQARHQSLVSSSSSSLSSPVKSVKASHFSRKIVGLDNLIIYPCNRRKKFHIRLTHVDNGKFSLSRLSYLRRQSINFRKSRMVDSFLSLSSSDDGMAVNASHQARTQEDVDEIRYKLNQSLQDGDCNTRLVQLLHDAARVFELEIKQQSSLSKKSWFSKNWLGVDKHAWVKPLSYQAAVLSQLLAASEISSRGYGRDRDINVFVQRSLSRQSAPLESAIRDKLLSEQPDCFDWFWSEQIPAVVASFVEHFEKEQRFSSATALYIKGSPSRPGNSSDVSLLILSLSCIAAITKLGPTKVSCAQFFSIIPDTSGRLMDMLVEFVPVRQAYHSIKETGLRREFLVHFGPRAASCRVKNELGAEEITFWVDLVQRQLQRAIDRERIWSRLTTSESIEVLERDLAIFGFFIALGRSTQSFLCSNGFKTMDEPIEEFIRYLIGGTVLYYPQLSAISSYQLYVEVVCEELDWLPFYPGYSNISKPIHGHKHEEGPPNPVAIPLALDVCSHWIESFIKYSKWLENPSNVKAARFLSKGHNKLKVCMEDMGIKGVSPPVEKESQSFDKALESVEEALIRLEDLLQELHVSSFSSGKEHLKAACSDLERIRKLKKEAEFLEASFRAKEASLQQGNVAGESTSSFVDQEQYSNGKDSKNFDLEIDRSSSSGFWDFIMLRTPNSSGLGNGRLSEQAAEVDITESGSEEYKRFELLRNELMELERRVQKSTDQCQQEEDEIQMKGDTSKKSGDSKSPGLVNAQKKDGIIEKSLDKLKETSTNVLQGTQLLAIDTASAMGLLRRALIGDEITEKEKQALRRTLTDLASVVPIGVLMLLPVTAVGHAAMLAAIQRYMPGLIPSTYGPERLDLLRQLEKLKEMEDEASTNDDNDDKNDSREE
ncbi:uncharacterized protein LOC127264873 [Andrographis paniculata]|uniref:uncharacterized protein LOC127264873 n=1 Tax=Andrographis paniculata TaxID=175694 RepID=UPI0021E72BC6|nr:uncharacterized protein LOC127264873 [Andrographis paniculata]